MKIAHFAPFSPNACGMYEAARDFIRADRLAGRVSELVDTGGSNGTTRAPLRCGEKDCRGGFEIVSRRFDECRDFDLFVLHDIGEFTGQLATTCTPAVLIVHGRPAACFRPEQAGKWHAYSFVAQLAQWPRIKKVVTMWSEFAPYWQTVVPAAKLCCTEDPPIDCELYKPEGIALPMLPVQRGEWNLLICDSWREDIDIFEITQGAICAARQIPERFKAKPGWLKIHFYGVEHKPDKQPLGAWNCLFEELKRLGALGIVHGRFAGNMAEIYRSMDLLISPHRIAVRTIGEALACGLPVVADYGSRYTPYQAPFQDCEAVANQICTCLEALATREADVRAHARSVAVEKFGLKDFGMKLGAIYASALHCQPSRLELVDAA